MGTNKNSKKSITILKQNTNKELRKQKRGKANLLETKYNVTFVGEPCIEHIISGFELFFDKLSLGEKEDYKEFISLYNDKGLNK